MAVEALCHLKLRGEPFCRIMLIVDVAAVQDAFVCYVIVIQINNDGTMLCFAGEFFFTEESDFGDSSALEVAGSLEYLDDFGILQI